MTHRSNRVARSGRMRVGFSVAAVVVMAALTGCQSMPQRHAEPYELNFDEWVDLTFQTYSARLDYPGVYRVFWDGRAGGRFVFVSYLEPGEKAFGNTTIEQTLHSQVALMADTVRRDCLEWSERGFDKDHTEIRFIMRFPPKRDIEVRVWERIGSSPGGQRL